MMRGINLASLVRQHPCQLWGRGMLCTTYRVASVYELWYQWRSPSPTLGISPPFGVVYTRSRIFLAFLPPGSRPTSLLHSATRLAFSDLYCTQLIDCLELDSMDKLPCIYIPRQIHSSGEHCARRSRSGDASRAARPCNVACKPAQNCFSSRR